MTARISPDVAAEILAVVDRCARSDRELDAVACSYGLFLGELKHLIRNRPPEPPPAPEPAPRRVRREPFSLQDIIAANRASALRWEQRDRPGAA